MQKYNIVFYSKGDSSPVRDFIAERTKKEISKILFCMELLKSKGRELTEPYSKNIENGINELRVVFAGNAFRLFYYWDGNDAVFVHAIHKKDMKLKRNDIEIAIKRMKELEGDDKNEKSK